MENEAEADRQTAEHGARDAADPADDRGGERDQADLEADIRIDVLEDQAVHHAGGTASTDPMKNVTTMTRSTLIPIIDAASRSNDVARIARRPGSRDEDGERGHQAHGRDDHEELHVLDPERADRDAREQRPAVERERVVLLRRRPEQEHSCWRKKDTPRALIRAARSARRVSRARAVREPLDDDTERPAPSIAARTSARSPRPMLGSARPSHVSTKYPMYEPIMKTSPWAKLRSFRIPYTIE